MLFRKCISLLIILLIAGTAFSTQPEWYYLLEIDSTTQKPAVIYPGDQVNLAVTLINKGVRTNVLDVNMELSLPQGFEPRRLERNIDLIKNKETQTAVFVFSSSEFIASGTYTVPLTISYDNRGTIVTETKYLTIVVSDLYRVSISNISVSDYFPHIGDNIIITADLKNTGSLEARDVSASLSMVGSQGFEGFIVLSDTFKEIGSILPRETDKAEFKIMPSTRTEPGIYTFSITADCDDCLAPREQKFSVHLYGHTNLIVSGMDYSAGGDDDKKVRQGESFSLSVQMDNLGEEDADQIRVNLKTSEGILGSKTSNLNKIEADDSGSVIFDLFVDEAAELGDTEIFIEISYLDELKSKQVINESFTLHVFPAPEPSPYMHYIFIIVILILVYIIMKVVIRQLAIRKL